MDSVVPSITALYASLSGLLLIGLTMRVVADRRRAQVGLGTGSDPGLERAVRVHGNFVEYVPLALMLLLIAEFSMASPWLLHLLGAQLVLGRLLHAWGLGGASGVSFGRFWGTLLTLIMILVTSLLNLWLLLG